MEKIQFEVDINAPASKVYHAVLDKTLFEEWTSEFNPTSTFDGGWNKGDKILFIGISSEGKREGMVAKIEENIPDKQISIRHMGIVDGDQEVLEGPAVEGWAGAMEEYFLSQKDGQTNFKVTIDVNEDFKEYMMNTWPKALRKLKEIGER